MRCLSIAKALRKEKQDCCFVLADSEFKDKIESNGFKSIVLNTKFNDLESETNALIQIIIKDGSILVVDSYFVTEKYLEELKRAIKLVYIDDLVSFAYPVDILINYNIYADENKYLKLYENKGQSVPALLLGTKYAPLREEFINLPKKVINDDVKNIFVSTGASDSLHIALKLITEIKEKGSQYRYYFVIGEKNNDIDEITRIAKTLTNVEINYKVANISELMRKCDVAISAAGSTLYELCGIGIPTITYVLADNQIDGITEFEKQDLTLNIGDLRTSNLNFATIEKAINTLANASRRKELSSKTQSIVDGLGASRIANHLISMFI